MLGEVVVIAALFAAGLLVLLARSRRSGRSGGSTAGHHDPAAIGKYTMDPATLSYRYDLPNVPPGSGSPPPGSGPPGKLRRHRRRPDRD
jgi:hypothetical protein